jgi:hypothetical protein
MYFKRIAVPFVFFLIWNYSYSQTIYRSDTTGLFNHLNKISKKYIGQNLGVPFNLTIEKVLTEPEIVIDTIINRSDTSVFYLRAYHKTFNPFKIELDSVRLIIAEIIRHDTWTKTIIDTAIYLQTEGIVIGQEKIKSLRPKFQSLNKEVNHFFSFSRYSKTKIKNELTGEGISYYSTNMPLLNITWQKRNSNEAVIVITLELSLQYPPDRM